VVQGDLRDLVAEHPAHLQVHGKRTVQRFGVGLERELVVHAQVCLPRGPPTLRLGRI
jgi:hypothetical protein